MYFRSTEPDKIRNLTNLQMMWSEAIFTFYAQNFPKIEIVFWWSNLTKAQLDFVIECLNVWVRPSGRPSGRL
jgi:hypothetical protein